MAEIAHVANVREAVELARSWQADGSCDWFRGQVRDWPPVSTLFRLHRDGSPEDIARAGERFKLYYEWVTATPALVHLLYEENIHQFFAIAQHYGLPTHYIDFSLDPAVAGFFAADTRSPPAEGYSCIYCAKSAELGALSKAKVEAGATKHALELVKIDVSNLWRLHAQRGVFVVSDFDWSVDYPLHRILFPYTGYPDSPGRQLIYPPNKSSLELLLDQYFDVVSTHFGAKQVVEIHEELKKRGANSSLTHIQHFPDGFYRPAFAKPDNLTLQPGWDNVKTAEWHYYPDEHFDHMAPQVQTLRIGAGDGSTIEAGIVEGVRKVLADDPTARHRLIEWKWHHETAESADERTDTMFRGAWDGMRNLPFSNEQIASVMGSVARLSNAKFGESILPAVRQRIFSELNGPSIRVEFSYADGSASNGYVTIARFMQSIRSDLRDLVLHVHRPQIDEPQFVLQLVQNPALLFEFNRFVDLFVSELIPSQLALGRQPTLFNPAAVTRFGNP